MLVVGREEDLMRQGATVKYAQLAKWLCLCDEQTQEILRLRSDVLSRLERLVVSKCSCP